MLNEYLISFSMLFQTTGPEYEMLSLYKAKLGFGTVKFSFVMDLKEVFCAISDLRLNISLIYRGTKPFATLNKIVPLFRNTLCSNESIVNGDFALSKSTYSLPNTVQSKRFFTSPLTPAERGLR